MKQIIYVIIFSLLSISMLAQEKNVYFELFPSGLNFIPLKANIQEPRIGVLYYTATSNLKVDIGNTSDVLSLYFQKEKLRFAMAIEFMAYAYSTSYAGYRLQIDAVDGFFGGDVTMSKNFEKNRLLGRFRIIHNSAHFVDGHYDRNEENWIGEYKPIPYTKDFGEITVAHEINSANYLFKYYGGLSYASLVRPSILKRWNYHFGFELGIINLFGELLNRDQILLLANHFKLDGTSKYIGSQQTILGWRFGSYNSKGVTLYLSYYTGEDIFNSYLGNRIKKFGVGFTVDFF